ncbi:hypothetical protein MA16_Dca005706 [Dendrobium catenatum]|uniref:Uncharacterized protein n=1 Tax=Dendrobium catenatum TaxID=906689 RepID=A0A2I0WQD3_9ASPA|nr:hypothetical protein MA16_Dca005706 [Dendrobium catenatum]
MNQGRFYQTSDWDVKRFMLAKLILLYFGKIMRIKKNVLSAWNQDGKLMM